MGAQPSGQVPLVWRGEITRCRMEYILAHIEFGSMPACWLCERSSKAILGLSPQAHAFAPLQPKGWSWVPRQHVDGCEEPSMPPRACSGQATLGESFCARLLTASVLSVWQF